MVSRKGTKEMSTIYIFSPDQNADATHVKHRGPVNIGYRVPATIDEHKLSENAKRMVWLLKYDVSDTLTYDDLVPRLIQRVQSIGIIEAAELLGYPEEAYRNWVHAYEESVTDAKIETHEYRCYGLHHAAADGMLEVSLNEIADVAGICVKADVHATPAPVNDSGPWDDKHVQAERWRHMLQQGMRHKRRANQ
jgi:hypothetical protein